MVGIAGVACVSIACKGLFALEKIGGKQLLSYGVDNGLNLREIIFILLEQLILSKNKK